MKGLEVRGTEHGRGVFALRAYAKGETLERSPVMVIPPQEMGFSNAIRAVYFYRYFWHEPHWSDEGAAIALGRGSLYNDGGAEANLAFARARDEPRVMVYTAKRDIAAGEELTICYRWQDDHAEYGYGPTDCDGLPVVPSRRAPADATPAPAGRQAPRNAMDGLEIRDAQHGRGVFATAAFRRGETVERCPVVLIPPAELVFAPHVRCVAYSWFPWVRPHWPKGGGAICLGYGSLYNAADEPNVVCEVADDEDRVIVFTALRDIQPGEELTRSYPWPTWMKPVGFGPTDADGLPLDVPRRERVVAAGPTTSSTTAQPVA